MNNYVYIKDLNLSSALIVDMPSCSEIKVKDSYIVCLDSFGDEIVKYKFDKDTKYLLNQGIPSNVVVLTELNEAKSFECFYDDEDDECYEEIDLDVLKKYSHIVIKGTVIIINNEA